MDRHNLDTDTDRDTAQPGRSRGGRRTRQNSARLADGFPGHFVRDEGFRAGTDQLFYSAIRTRQ